MSEVHKPFIGSLFAGIGGFDLGFERAGFKSIWASEIDPKARQVLAKRFPKMELQEDIKTFNPEKFDCPRCIVFGSPCQDFSYAGNRSGIDGKSSNLFYEATRIIREYVKRGLRYAVWENVPGAFTSNDGHDFAMVLKSLADCGAMDIAWRVLDGQYFGVAQRRRRVFLVSDFGGESASEILSLAEGLQRNPPPSREAKSCTAGDATKSTETSGANDLKVCSTLDASYYRLQGTSGQDANHGHSHLVPDLTGPCTAKWAKMSGGPSGDECQNLLPDTSDPLTGKNWTGRKWAINTRQDRVIMDDCSMPLESSVPQSVGVQVQWASGRGKRENNTAQSLRANAEANYQFLRQNMAVRRLTPKECERLQGFPDDWTAGQADTHRYRQLGNAVCVPVVEWIAKNLIKAT